MAGTSIATRVAVSISIALTTIALVHASAASSTVLAQPAPGTWRQPSPPPTPVPSRQPATITGACTVTGYAIPRTCTEGLTFEDCQRVAYRVQGLASWQRDQPCKAETTTR